MLQLGKKCREGWIFKARWFATVQTPSAVQIATSRQPIRVAWSTTLKPNTLIALILVTFVAEFNLPKPPWICTSAECTEITQWKLNKNILPFSVLDNLISSKMGRDPSTGAWYCVDCHYESANKGDVGNHIEAKHVETAGASCDICGIVTKTRKAMKMHKMRQHKPLPPFWLLCRIKHEIKL